MGGVIESSEEVIRLLKERRSALISAAVTGQIDVRGLVPEASAV
jgi:type I restriction enzyme S subunit